MKKFALIIIMSSVNSLFGILETVVVSNTTSTTTSKIALVDTHEENSLLPHDAASNELVKNMVKAQRINVKLPSAQHLYGQLKSYKLVHFADVTQIHRTLGNQTKTPRQIINAVDNAIFEYNHKEALITTQKNTLKAKQKVVIITSILKHDDTALCLSQKCRFFQQA